MNQNEEGKTSPETNILPLRDTTRIIDNPGRPAALQIRKARIQVIKGPNKGQEKELKHLGMVIGGSPDCDLVLDDPAISRRHIELQPTENGYLVRDLGSKNGTYIRGLRIVQAILSGEEELEIGRSCLRFTLLDDLDELPLSRNKSFGKMVGRSLAMRQVFAVLERVADTDYTVLLEGESGTGKDLAAESLHGLSIRKDGPFVIIDCGAVNPSLVESELFGHCKGSFTGAARDRPGVFESAKGGTVFLDEISEIDLSLQPKLLRLLEKREVRRVGENHYHTVDVRIIGATNRDLSHEVEQGRFREDLFYRLSVVRVHMPPLRDRREDIVMLAKDFITKRNPETNPNDIITDQVMAMFLNHDWPGNVRELRNVVERLMLFPDRPQSAISRSPTTEETMSMPSNFLDLNFRDFQEQLRKHYEKAYLSAMLDACDGVMAWAAKRSGLPRQTFYRLIKKYQLKK